MYRNDTEEPDAFVSGSLYTGANRPYEESSQHHVHHHPPPQHAIRPEVDPRISPRIDRHAHRHKAQAPPYSRAPGQSHSHPSGNALPMEPLIYRSHHAGHSRVHAHGYDRVHGRVRRINDDVVYVE